LVRQLPRGNSPYRTGPLAATPHSFLLTKKGELTFKDHILQRVLAEADHIVRTGDTVRGTAKVFGVSKTTVHLDMTMRLPRIHSRKAKEVNKVLEFNFNEKHIRGGLARREKCKGGEK
jgi:putative DeoR family transcriptional regulator (stage III sporulation protein D)